MCRDMVSLIGIRASLLQQTDHQCFSSGVSGRYLDIYGPRRHAEYFGSKQEKRPEHRGAGQVATPAEMGACTANSSSSMIIRSG